MKNAVIILLVALVLFSAFVFFNLYPRTTEVVEIDREEDVVTCEDFCGRLWQFEGCEDWQVGDVCSLLMFTNGTEIVFDDVIVLARYGGTFQDWN